MYIYTQNVTYFQQPENHLHNYQVLYNYKYKRNRNIY